MLITMIFRFPKVRQRIGIDTIETIQYHTFVYYVVSTSAFEKNSSSITIFDSDEKEG